MRKVRPLGGIFSTMRVCLKMEGALRLRTISTSWGSLPTRSMSLLVALLLLCRIELAMVLRMSSVNWIRPPEFLTLKKNAWATRGLTMLAVCRGMSRLMATRGLPALMSYTDQELRSSGPIIPLAVMMASSRSTWCCKAVLLDVLPLA